MLASDYINYAVIMTMNSIEDVKLEASVSVAREKT